LNIPSDSGEPFTCKCHPGFEGSNCESQIDYCFLNPCENGKGCRNIKGGYQCGCGLYQGSNCEIQPRYYKDITVKLSASSCDQPDLVQHFHAHPQSSCTEVSDLATASIVFRYASADPMNAQSDFESIVRSEINEYFSSESGESIQITHIPQLSSLQFSRDINACNSNSCENGGKCVDLPGNASDFICECEFGFEGESCEFVLDFCQENPCRNGAECTSINGEGYFCECKAGFSGKNCDSDEFCSSEACSTEGSDGCSSGKCICKSGFSGRYCETKSVCFESCDTGQVCIETRTDFICIEETQNFTIDNNLLSASKQLVLGALIKNDVECFVLSNILKNRVLNGKKGFRERFLQVYIMRRLAETGIDNENKSPVIERPPVSLKMASHTSSHSEMPSVSSNELTTIDEQILDDLYRDTLYREMITG